MNCLPRWHAASTNARATSRLRLLERKWTEMARTKLEVPVQGMDCAECTMHVQHALAALPGVDDVHVLLSSEKAVLQIDPSQVDLPTIRKAVEGAGYTFLNMLPLRKRSLPAKHSRRSPVLFSPFLALSLEQYCSWSL